MTPDFLALGTPDFCGILFVLFPKKMSNTQFFFTQFSRVKTNVCFIIYLFLSLFLSFFLGVSLSISSLLLYNTPSPSFHPSSTSLYLYIFLFTFLSYLLPFNVSCARSRSLFFFQMYRLLLSISFPYFYITLFTFFLYLSLFSFRGIDGLCLF